MFIRKSKHDAAIAAKDAEIARLMKRITSMATSLKTQSAAATYYAGERDKALAKLAVFTAPRQRDNRGRYQPTSRKRAQVQA